MTSAPSAPRRLVLASGSPRRRSLLEGLGARPLVRPVDLDETPQSGESPEALVRRLAHAKASATAEAGELVLAADTIVVLDGEILGKPRDAADAERMLGRLAGRRHRVLTGLALHDVDSGREILTIDESHVRMASLSPVETAWYVDTGEPLDKAGAYAIQGLGALFVEAVDGSYTNVVGLPLPVLRQAFLELDLDLRDFLVAPVT